MLNLFLVAFAEYLLAPARIAGLSFIIIGIALALISKKLTRVIKKTEEIDKSDKTYLTILTIALVAILAGMIICCFN